MSVSPARREVRLQARPDEVEEAEGLLPSIIGLSEPQTVDTDTADAPEATEAVTAVAPRRRFPWAKKLLLVYTLVRIGVNFGVLLSSELEWQGMLNMVDGLLRPLITGLGVYSFIGDDFHADNSLHVWSWRLSLALASFLADPALLSIRDASPTLIRCYFLTVNTFLIHLVNLKLHALGFKNTARCSHILLMLLLAAGVAIMQPVALVMCTAAATVQSVFLSVAAYSSAASSGETYRSLRFTAFLYVATGVVLLGLVVLDVQGELDGHHGHVHGHVYLLTPYALLQTVTVLALSGISSSLMQRLQYLFDKLLETCRRGLGNCRKGLVRGLGGEVRESDFAITGKRITVLGHTNNASRHCICSFPGKYGDLWDNAASSTYACSLACVFLTDQDSGLGRHAEKPDLPGGCWCHTIYGPLTPDAYLREVEETSSSHDEIAFKRADAEAMGQIFLLKTLMDERDEQAWSQKKAEAKCQAEERCRENDEKAPWGCLWLQVWMRNIDIAKVLEQKLHVFFFEGKVGKGKLAWDQLSHQDAVKEARKDTGLGASQTVEVAYLEKEGLEYEEHDIREFKKFMKEHRGK